MALPHPDVNAVLRFPAKLGTSHKKAPQNLVKTPFAPSNFPPRRHTAAPHVFLRRAGRLCPPKHTPTAPALCPYPVIPSQCSHWRGNPHPAPAGAESLPPSAREVTRSAGGRDVDPPHPRCSSVGGDAHIAPHTAPAVSFRASDRRHWRGNPFPAPAGAELPASLCEGGVNAKR